MTIYNFCRENRIWVTYKKGVYDITDFVDEHPGGNQILMAAGNSVEPFWILYRVHVNPHVLEVLEKYRIGMEKKSRLISPIFKLLFQVI